MHEVTIEQGKGLTSEGKPYLIHNGRGTIAPSQFTTPELQNAWLEGFANGAKSVVADEKVFTA